MRFLATPGFLKEFAADTQYGHIDFTTHFGPLVREVVQLDHDVRTVTDKAVNDWAHTYLKSLRRPRDSATESARKRIARDRKKAAEKAANELGTGPTRPVTFSDSDGGNVSEDTQ